jgi:hypothetical protein
MLSLALKTRNDGHITSGSTGSPINPAPGEPLNGREVEYKDTIPPFKDGSQAHMTLLTKYKKWEYEREYRVLMGVNPGGDRIRKYKLSQLRGAIFGMHMDSSDEHLVRCWFKKGGHKTPFFKKTQLSEDGFTLRYIDV